MALGEPVALVVRSPQVVPPAGGLAAAWQTPTHVLQPGLAASDQPAAPWRAPGGNQPPGAIRSSPQRRTCVASTEPAQVDISETSTAINHRGSYMRRCRWSWPEEAGIGLVPARAAKAASERHRPAWDQLIKTWGSGDQADAEASAPRSAIAVTSLWMSRPGDYAAVFRPTECR